MSANMNELDVLVDGLSSCREEDRDAFNQMLQAIAACMTALTIIFAVSNGLFGSGGEISDFVAFLCEIITVAVLVAGSSYMISLGMQCSLRYHHMRWLESEISRLVGDEGRIGWIELRAAQGSLNPRHLRSPLSVLHYVGYALSALGILVMAICFVLMFWEHNPSLTGVLLFMVVLPYCVFVMACCVWSTMDSEEAYKTAKEVAIAKRGASGLFGDKPNVKWLIGYLLYPRPQDAMKGLFLVAGAFLGMAASGCFRDFLDGPLSYVGRIMLVWVVLDLLCYQARYQWNDILGAEEDENNPMADERQRLKRMFGSYKLSKTASAAMLLYKLVLAVVLSITAGGEMAAPLLVGMAATIVLAIAYELARARGTSPRAIYLLVSLGYPLRVVAGFLCFVPLTWGIVPSLPCEYLVAGALVLVGTALFGNSFVGITWALEGASHARGCWTKGADPDATAIMGTYHKRHIARRALSLDVPTKASGGSLLFEEHPLIFRRPVFVSWNMSMLTSQALLALALWGISSGFLGGTCAVVRMAFCVGGVVMTLATLAVPGRAIASIVVGVLWCVFCFVVAGGGGLAEVPCSAFCFLVVLVSVFYGAIYAVFRTLSYEDMVKAPANMLKALKAAALAFLRVLLEGFRVSERGQ